MMKYTKGVSRPQQRDDKHGNWKGDAVGYVALHAWVRRRRGTPTTCEHCGLTKNDTYQFHWANKSGLYKRELDDWLRLCVKCHQKYDGVGKRRAISRKSKYNFYIGQFNTRGNLIKKHISVNDAARELSILHTSIANNLSGRTKSAGGFMWRKVIK